jgi:hypothetical protein
MKIRSALENSPGYYPPDDPEWESQITGRRMAPAIEEGFSGGASSLEALARSLVAEVERKSESGLHGLRVTRTEFERILWPEFPQSRPITHIPVGEAWGFSLAQSLAGASRTVGAYGGRPLAFLRADYADAVPYRNFTMYRGVRIMIRDSRDGRVHPLAFVPSAVERRGRFKALLFED